MFRLFVGSISIVVVLFTGLLIQAQESQVTFEQLQADYLFQLEQYSKAENRFNLDKAEFNQLQTLASREKAVESMRPYLDARAKVLATYLSALEFQLSQAQGIDISDKNNTLNKIDQSKQYMANFRQTIPTLVDRESINSGAENFENEGLPLFTEAQYRALTLLAIGKVQRNFDQYELALAEFKQDYYQPIPDESVKARVERGLKDVDFHFQEAEELLNSLVLEFPDFPSEAERSDPRYKQPNFQATYNQTVTDLQTVNGSLRQSLRFLIELERQI